MSERTGRRFRLGIIGASLIALSACAGFTPKPYLPGRGNVEAGEIVTVKDNENIYAIARAHNVSMRDLIVLNNLKPPYTIRSGQHLTLPAGAASGSSGDSMPPPQAAPRDAVEQDPLAPIEPGSVSSQTLAPIDLPPAPIKPQAGVPSSSSPPAATATPLSLAPVSMPQSAARPLAPAVSAEPVTALNHPVAPLKPLATTTAATPASDEADSHIRWPVQGPILSAFGAKGTGLNNDGVNIGAPKGSPVVAAAAGTVVYAGNEMKGFGNLVLIRHAHDLVTAYAHLDRVLVHKDAVVDQGDMIGTVGKTGNVAMPQLHFETRKNGKPIDPAGIVKGDM